MTAVERSLPYSTIPPWRTKKTLPDKHTGSKRFWPLTTSKDENIQIESSCRNES